MKIKVNRSGMAFLSNPGLTLLTKLGEVDVDVSPDREGATDRI